MNSTIKHHTYNETEVYWKSYQKFFPEELRMTEDCLPVEEWWDWNHYHIHENSCSFFYKGCFRKDCC